MNYVDGILVRLADPATRTAVFDATALEQIVSAAYDATAIGAAAPFTPVFDEFRLGVSSAVLARVEGTWNVSGSTERTEARLHIGGLSTPSAVRIDALWRGAIVARTAPATSSVISVDVDWPAFSGIDEEIVAALGALPVDPATLESERRTRLRGRIAGAFDQPTLVTPARVDQWLRDIGAASAGEFLAAQSGVTQATRTIITFAAPIAAPLAPRRLSVCVALLVRDAGFSLAQLLSDTLIARERLEPAGVERARNGGPQPRFPIVIAWVIPESVFDDTDWPGATDGMAAAAARAARSATAGAWLTREGIGLVVTT